jgi:outer membrane immunogenic protein
MTIRPYLLSTVSALAIASQASAADMPVKAPAPFTAVVSWTGFYVGAHGGVGWLDASQTITGPVGTTCVATLNARCDVDAVGAVFGGQIGYNWQSGAWVFGLEADASGTSLKGTETFAYPGFSHVINDKVDWLASVRGRLGWAVGDTLFYGTGGVAFGQFDAGWLRIGGPARAQFSETMTGWVAGGGIEKLLGRNWSARVEFLYYGFGKDSHASTIGGTYTTAFRHNVSAVRLGLNFRP